MNDTKSNRLTDEQLAMVLVLLCRYQVEYTQARRLKDAVRMRTNARAMGREILRRRERGEWLSGTR